MASHVNWSRLVRYLSEEGQVRYGEPQVTNSSVDIRQLAQRGDLSVDVFDGDTALSAKPTGRTDKVKSLLGPLTVSEIPYIRCIGLNYKTHILETGRELPSNPTVFSKPGTAINGPIDNISVPRVAQAQCDYEGELVILIGKEAKNVPVESALEYVAAYTTGNDVSSRDWQREPEKAGPIPQWSFSKSFDGYAPIGPCLVAASVLGAADKLTLETRVNGQVRQKGSTSDLCFGVAQLVSFCSQGQTLQVGSLIMTGTPGGVGLFMKPPEFLKDGDQVSVEISGIGSISNRVCFEET